MTDVAHDRPAPAGAAPGVPQARSRPRAVDIPDGPRCVLLVEDDDGDALLVEEYLGMSPASPRLRRARNLAEAVAALKDHSAAGSGALPGSGAVPGPGVLSGSAAPAGARAGTPAGVSGAAGAGSAAAAGDPGLPGASADRAAPDHTPPDRTPPDRAASGRTAADRTPPDCVLLDLHLPDAFGVGAVTRLLTSVPGIAVVVLTGLSEEDAGLAAVAAGAHEYLSKNRLDPQSLDRAIRYAVQRRQIEQARAALRESLMRAEENARLERGLLPTPLLRTDEWAVTARYRPGRDHALLGGDFYDVVQGEDGTVHVVIGDVSGHGAAEAALGVCLRVAWRSFVLAGTVGAERARLLEQMLVAERASADVFATLVELEFPADRGEVRIVRAGHPGILVRRGTEVDWLEPSCGPALGLLPGTARWPVSTRPLRGESFVLFTDGLFEWRRGAGPERLGEEGLLALAREHRELPADAFVDALITAAEQATARYGGLSDDAAVVHVGWRPDR
jgi:serine phosphatase RsbU (regulator of sigma subunit)